jgi:hypothetical protein
MLKLLGNFAENVYVSLVTGLILLVSSSIEVVNTLDSGVIGAHHGVLVFSIYHILKTLPELQHGAAEVSKIKDR